jgi:hypothetical protein
MRVLLALAVAGLLAGAVACGSEESSSSSEKVNLRVRVEDGKGKVARATLACPDGGDAHGSGFLSARAEQHCAAARRLQRLLTRPPPSDRVCTQLYGGPQTAHIAGTLAGQAVARDLGRRNGCEIADWKRAEPLLAPSGIPVGGP